MLSSHLAGVVLSLGPAVVARSHMSGLAPVHPGLAVKLDLDACVCVCVCVERENASVSPGRGTPPLSLTLTSGLERAPLLDPDQGGAHHLLPGKVDALLPILQADRDGIQPHF